MSKGILLNKGFFDLLRGFSPGGVRNIMMALADYAFEGAEPGYLRLAEKAVFELVKAQIDGEAVASRKEIEGAGDGELFLRVKSTEVDNERRDCESCRIPVAL